MEHDTPRFARILKEYGSVSRDFRATTRLFSRSVSVNELLVYELTTPLSFDPEKAYVRYELKAHFESS